MATPLKHESRQRFAPFFLVRVKQKLGSRHRYAWVAAQRDLFDGLSPQRRLRWALASIRYWLREPATYVCHRRAAHQRRC